MFNLEYELGKWHGGMTAAGLKSPEVVGELEEHLRDDIDQQMRSGVGASEAFRIAVERLGGARALRTEFDLVRPVGVRATLRRHGWKIALCTAVGVLAAFVVLTLRPPIYVSEAKLLIRAIVADPPAGVPLDQRFANMAQGQSPDHIMREEKAILSSLDLASEVVRRIGREQILRKAGGGQDADTALKVLRSGLRVHVWPGSSVIHLGFRHPDSTIVQPVIREVIEHYLKLHVATHRARDRAGDERAFIGRVSNISTIQAPSRPFLDSANTYRPIAMTVAVGVSVGFAWVLAAVWFSRPDRRQRSIG